MSAIQTLLPREESRTKDGRISKTQCCVFILKIEVIIQPHRWTLLVRPFRMVD